MKSQQTPDGGDPKKSSDLKMANASNILLLMKTMLIIIIVNDNKNRQVLVITKLLLRATHCAKGFMTRPRGRNY